MIETLKFIYIMKGITILLIIVGHTEGLPF